MVSYTESSLNLPSMPADIRSFFGGKPGTSTSTPIRGKENKKEEDPKKKKSSKFLRQHNLLHNTNSL